MTFNIGSQSGGIVNNVAGDQHNYGGQYVSVTIETARQAVRDLGEGLARVPLDARVADQARADLEALSTAVHAPRPEPSTVVGPLDRLTRLLSAAGSLTTAGTALVGPLRTLAGWLGALGEPILHMLG
jgi:hypothetical protein